MRELKMLDQENVRSVRFCSNKKQHRVFGYNSWKWYCSECGIQWALNVYSGSIQSYQYLADGTKEFLEEVSLESFLEKKREG
ncbi:hypothetical protein [Ammoniphilus sp. 3BR4]|uniref:hypothetical protein n=1 Tax=Ammoniphilus sp. 3BR4 TaxID=3158265 RepID=UPI0034659148